MTGQIRSAGFKFFFGIDAAHPPVIHLVGGLDLADNLGDPLLGHMTIRASCAHAGRIGKVYRLLVFLVDGALHFMA